MSDLNPTERQQFMDLKREQADWRRDRQSMEIQIAESKRDQRSIPTAPHEQISAQDLNEVRIAREFFRAFEALRSIRNLSNN